VAVRVIEIDAPAAVVVIDLAGPLAAKIGVVRDTPGANTRQSGVELGLADQEGVVPGGKTPRIRRNRG
jgi:hypothetical protein